MRAFFLGWLEEARELMRRPALFVTGVVVPVFWVVALVGMFSTGLMRDIAVGVVDLDGSAQSRELVRELDAIPSVGLIGMDSVAAAKEALASSCIYGLVVVPPQWAQKSAGARDDSAIELYLNRSYYAVAVTIESDVKTAMATMAARKLAASAAKTGGGFHGASQRVMVLSADVLISGNSAINYKAYLMSALIPGVLALGCILTSLGAVTRHWRRGTMRGWLQADGHVRARLMGTLTFWGTLYALYGLGYIAWFAGWCGWSPQGSLLLWCAGIVLLMSAMAAVALMLTVLSPSWVIALSAACCYIAPTFPFTGFSFPIDAMDRYAQLLSNIFPLTWFLRVQSSQWVLASSLEHSLGLLSTLALFTAVPLVIGLTFAPMRFRRIAAHESAWVDTSEQPQGFWHAAWLVIKSGVTNRDTFIIFVAASAFYLVFYAWPYANQQITGVPVAVVDLDATALSRTVTDRIRSLPAVDVRTVTTDAAHARELYRNEAVAAVITLPDRFEEFALSGKPTALRVTANGAFPVKSRAVSAGVLGLMQELSMQSAATNLVRAGARTADIKVLASQPVALTDQSLYNTLSGYAGYIVPVAMPIIEQAVLLMCVMMVLGGWLAASKPPKILSFVLPSVRGLTACMTGFWCFGMVWILYALGPDFVLFDFTSMANPAAALSVAALFIASVVTFGTAMTLVLNSNAYGAQFFVLISAPSVFLSGAVYPAFDFTPMTRAIASLLPTTPGVIGMVNAAQNGASIASVMPQITLLAVQVCAYGALAFFMARVRAAQRGLLPREAR